MALLSAEGWNGNRGVRLWYTWDGATIKIEDFSGYSATGSRISSNSNMTYTVYSDAGSRSYTDYITPVFENGWWSTKGSYWLHDYRNVSIPASTNIYITVSVASGNGAGTYTINLAPYTDAIAHWCWGWKNGEGNNGDHTGYQIGTTNFSYNASKTFVLNSSRGITPPRGFTLNNKFGSGDITGSWATYTMPYTAVQWDKAMGFEYDYSPNNYPIYYNLNGGTNNSNNPASYTLPYGVNLSNPTRSGYTFVGWDVTNRTDDFSRAAGDSDYAWTAICGSVLPNTQYKIHFGKITRTAGSASRWEMRLYDFSSSTTLGTYIFPFGENLSATITAPSSVNTSHITAFIIYAGMSGSTAGNTVEWKDISVTGKNCNKINKGTNISFSSVTELNNQLAANNRDIGPIMCTANWKQTEGYVKKSKVPDGYTQLEYIESTGTQYIDTLYKHKTNLSSYKMKITITNRPNTYHSIFGARTDHDSADAIYLGVSNAGTAGHTYLNIGGNKKDPIGWQTSLNMQYNIQIVPNQGLIVDETLYACPYSNVVSHTYTDYIFAFNTNNSPQEFATMKLYSFQIYESGTLQRDFVPCYRNSDNKPGLYDIKNNVFYTNKASTGSDFTKGPIVYWNKGQIFYKTAVSTWTPAKTTYHKQNKTIILPSEYTKLDYISSSGTQYINTGVYDTQGIKVDATIQWNSLLTGYTTMCGAQDATSSMANGANSLIMKYSDTGQYVWYAGNSNGGGFISNFYTLYSKQHIEASSIIGNSYIKINDIYQYYTDTSTRGSKPIYLFALNNNGTAGYFGNGKIFECKIYNHNNTLVRHFIPCKRNSDNKPGLYDIVNNVFYYNLASGDDFTAGTNSTWFINQ